MIAIGRLRRRVAIERPSGTPDGAGGTRDGWTAVAGAWAAIEPLGAGETVVAGRLDGVASHRIAIRFRADVAGGDRIVAGARVFRVLAAYDADERRRHLVCVCEEEGR